MKFGFSLLAFFGETVMYFPCFFFLSHKLDRMSIMENTAVM